MPPKLWFSLGPHPHHAAAAFASIIAMPLMLCMLAAEGLHAQDIAPGTNAKKPPPPALWAVNSFGTADTPNISIFQGTRLDKKTGAIGSSGISANANGALLDGITFDSSGDLWMAFCDGDSSTGYIAELSVSALRGLITTGGGQFTTIIEDPSQAATTNPPPLEYLTCPTGMVFDKSGNLWVESAGGSETSALPALLEYTDDELVPGKKLLQSPTPAAFIETPLIQANLHPSLALDKAGDLWQSGGVISTGDPSAEQETVAEYGADQLTDASPVTEPNQTLIVADTSVNGVLNAPSSIVFDANANLWVAFALGGTSNSGGIQMFAGTDLDGTGTVTPAPAVTLGSASFNFGKVELQSLAEPGGLAFDGSGDLWVANESQLSSKLGQGSLVELPASGLAANGNPVPLRAILATKNEANIGAPDYITFGPPLP
jgi:hypothetical protein